MTRDTDRLTQTFASLANPTRRATLERLAEGEATVSELERTLDAPTELVWKLWTDPEHFKHWYGPQSFSVPAAEFDQEILTLGESRTGTARETLPIPHDHINKDWRIKAQSSNTTSISGLPATSAATDSTCP